LAEDILGPNVRLTAGGYIIPEAEIFIEYGPNGAPLRAWRFPFDNLTLYDTLTGSFESVIGQFEIALGALPSTRVGR
jgi:hypothetical protein